MTNKQRKITVDVLMLIFVVLSFVRWDGASGFVFHAIVSSIFIILIIMHLWLNRNWIFSTVDAIREKRANKKTKQLFAVNLSLIIVWDITIITGFLAIPSFIYGLESFYIFGRIHAISSRIGAVLIIIHIFQHLAHIRGYLGLTGKN